jgi:hypothetical protein
MSEIRIGQEVHNLTSYSVAELVELRSGLQRDITALDMAALSIDNYIVGLVEPEHLCTPEMESRSPMTGPMQGTVCGRRIIERTPLGQLVL